MKHISLNQHRGTGLQNRVQLLNEDLQRVKDQTGWKFHLQNHPNRIADVVFSDSDGVSVLRTFLYMKKTNTWKIINGEKLEEITEDTIKNGA